jgi:hypothetical protein
VAQNVQRHVDHDQARLPVDPFEAAKKLALQVSPQGTCACRSSRRESDANGPFLRGERVPHGRQGTLAHLRCSNAPIIRKVLNVSTSAVPVIGTAVSTAVFLHTEQAPSWQAAATENSHAKLAPVLVRVPICHLLPMPRAASRDPTFKPTRQIAAQSSK